MRVLFFGLFLFSLIWGVSKKCDRSPASSEKEALSNLSKAIQAQPEVKEIIKKVEKTGNDYLKDAENFAKDHYLDIPMTVVATGAKVLVDKKVEISGDTPFFSNKYKVIFKPDEFNMSLEGDTFIQDMKYGISSGTHQLVNFSVHMDF